MPILLIVSIQTSFFAGMIFRIAFQPPKNVLAANRPKAAITLRCETAKS
jgi:hypothetical protein